MVISRTSGLEYAFRAAGCGGSVRPVPANAEPTTQMANLPANFTGPAPGLYAFPQQLPCAGPWLLEPSPELRDCGDPGDLIARLCVAASVPHPLCPHREASHRAPYIRVQNPD